MTYAVRGLGLFSSLVLVSTFPACTLAQSDAQAAAISTTTAAYVYIQTQGPQGSVYGFRASSTGKLSPISGSPFKPAGQIIGSTSTKFFTLGKTSLHSYGIASDGAIESELSQIPFFDYAGNECPSWTGNPRGAVLDHTGKYIYVALLICGAQSWSAEWQTYLIQSDGALSYDGDAEVQVPSESDDYPSTPSILRTENFAYSNAIFKTTPSPWLYGFRRTSAGTLVQMDFSEGDPPDNGIEDYVVRSPDASPTGNYLVVQLHLQNANTPKFGSYIVASNGNIWSNNAPGADPTSALNNPNSTFSPSGNLFVAYAGNEAIGASGNGIEIYNFNGAAPLTLYKTLLSGTPIDQVAFDSSNHMYAISHAENKVYVLNVTSTSVTQTSTWSIGSPFKMVVVSR